MTLTAILVTALFLVLAYIADTHRNLIREKRKWERYFNNLPKATKTKKEKKEIDRLLEVEHDENSYS